MEIIEREFGKGTLSLETGRLARQANGSVLVRYGDTMVLVAATAAKGTGIGADFFPLSVFYVEKAYAAIINGDDIKSTLDSLNDEANAILADAIAQ